MYCNKCGTNNEENSQFCKTCGMPLIKNQVNVNDANSVTPVTPQVNNEVTPNEFTNPSNLNAQVNMGGATPMNNTVASSAFSNVNNMNMDTNIPPQTPNQNNNIHNSIIRKSIKKSAKACPKGSLSGVASILLLIPLVIVLVFIFSTAFSAISANTVEIFTSGLFTKLIIFIMAFGLYFVVSLLFTFGLAKSSLDISRGEPITFSKVLAAPFKNFGPCIKFIGVLLLFLLISGILAIIPVVGVLLSTIFNIISMPALIIYMYLIADTSKIEKSISLAISMVKGHRVAFYALSFSFIGWLLLSSLTGGLLMIWLWPYMMISFANFYRHLNKEKDFNEATPGLSNGAIIGLFIGIYALVIGILAIFITPQIAKNIKDISNHDNDYKYDDYNYNIYDYDYDDYDDDSDDDDYDYDYDSISGSTKDLEGVRVFIPSGYYRTTVSGYEVSYSLSDRSVVIGAIKPLDASNISLDSYCNALIDTLKGAGYSNISTNKITINGLEWYKIEIDSATQREYNFLTKENDKIYMVGLSTTNYEEEEIAQKIQENLAILY